MRDLFLQLHGIALAVFVPAAIYFFYSHRYRSGIPWAIRRRIALGVERAAYVYRDRSDGYVYWARRGETT